MIPSPLKIPGSSRDTPKWNVKSFSISDSGMLEEYFAHLQRETSDVWPNHHAFQVGRPSDTWVTSEKVALDLGSLRGKDIVLDHRACRREQQPVLVSIVESMEIPKKGIPSLIWLEPVDCINSDLAHSLYFSSDLGRCVFLDTLAYRKARSGGMRGIAIRNDELIDEMVQGGSHILDGIPREDSHSQGNFTGAGELPLKLPRTKVFMGANFIWAATEKIDDNSIQLVDVLFGPV